MDYDPDLALRRALRRALRQHAIGLLDDCVYVIAPDLRRMIGDPTPNEVSASLLPLSVQGLALFLSVLISKSAMWVTLSDGRHNVADARSFMRSFAAPLHARSFGSVRLNKMVGQAMVKLDKIDALAKDLANDFLVEIISDASRSLRR